MSYDKLKEIHSKVFRKFQYEFDKDQYKEVEKWVMPMESFDGSTKIVGDCEDFALACRKLCRDAGLQTRLVVCYTETDEGHCVLECDGWILDNRYPKVISRDKLEERGYRWIAISGFTPGEDWHKIVG